MSRRVRVEELTAYGHRLCFRVGGNGPVILLIHGVTGTSRQWEPAMEALAQRYTVVAPDLLGHGESAKPRGDYSLGAYATGVRDLMVALGHRRATVVGHSLGGGIALQFAYQFPERCARLAVVSSGGLGGEVHFLLRAATLPGAELVLPLLAHARLLATGSAVGRTLGRLGLQPGPDLAEFARGYASLASGEARDAFVHTLRAVIDPGGQRVSAADRLHLAEALPSLIVWGGRDPIIPIDHGRFAHSAMPGSRLEVFEDAGHFPHLEEPLRFAGVLGDFVDSTKAAALKAEDLRERALSEPAPAARLTA